MKTEINGINYTEGLLSDSEKAVVDAMRKGAQINVFLDFKEEADAGGYVRSFLGVEDYSVIDYTTDKSTMLMYTGHSRERLISIFTQKS